MPGNTELTDLKDLVSALKDIQSNIKDMVEIFSKLPAGTHKGVGGDLILTTKEQEVLKIIQTEQARANNLLTLFTDLAYGRLPVKK